MAVMTQFETMGLPEDASENERLLYEFLEARDTMSAPFPVIAAEFGPRCIDVESAYASLRAKRVVFDNKRFEVQILVQARDSPGDWPWLITTGQDWVEVA